MVLGKNDTVGLKSFVHIFVQMVNKFADITTVFVVRSHNLPSVKSREHHGLMGGFFLVFSFFLMYCGVIFFS